MILFIILFRFIYKLNRKTHFHEKQIFLIEQSKTPCFEWEQGILSFNPSNKPDIPIKAKIVK